MRCIFFSLLLSLFILVDAWCALCQSNFSVLVTLDKDSGNTVKYSTPQIDGMNWRIDVDYDTMTSINGTFRFLRGVASCSEYVGNSQYTFVTGYQVTPADDVGIYCWCALRRPATTYFMFLQAYNSVDACVADCAAQCANGVRSSYLFRNHLFEGVW